MKETSRYLLGYLFGFIVIVVTIPLGFYFLSKLDGNWFPGKGLIEPETLRLVLFFVLFLPGALFGAWSNVNLFRIGKGGPVDAFGVSLSPQTKHLVTTGPYRYCRNPMMFGTLLLYGSLVILFNTISGLIALVVLTTLAVLLIKLSEEKRLVRDFGEEYLAYRKRVPMLIPFLPRML